MPQHRAPAPCGVATTAAISLAILAVPVASGQPSGLDQPSGPDQTPTQAAQTLDRVEAALANTGINAPVQIGPIDLRARRVWTWSAGAVRAVVLEQDVTVRLGSAEFRSPRAVVWLWSTGDGRQGVFAHFQEVDAPAGSTPGADVAGSNVSLDGVWDAGGDISLGADAVFEREPRADGVEEEAADLLALARRRLELHLDGRGGGRAPARRQAAMPVPPGERFLLEQDRRASIDRTPRPRDLTRPKPRVASDSASSPPPAPTLDPTFTSDGVFVFGRTERVELRAGPEVNAAVVPAGFAAQYLDRRERRTLELRSERAVVFLEPGPLLGALDAADAESVRGIYLEGGVLVSDGGYVLRADRAYYDVQAGRALVLDTVFQLFSPELNEEIYVRADAIRQASADQFSADDAEIANSSFRNPHFSVGAGRAIITRRQRSLGTGEYTEVDARHITLEAGGVPVAYFPRFAGDAERFPLREIVYGDSSSTGPVLRTTWDTSALFGVRMPEGVRSLLELDIYGERGLGIGADVDWTTSSEHDSHDGSFYSYVLPSDSGTDQLPSGRERELETSVRSFTTFDERWSFADHWTFFLEGFYASDETIAYALFEETRTSRELTNRVALRRVEGRSMLWGQAQAMSTDYVANDYLLQTPGYAVDRLPELGFAQVGIDLLPNTIPGRLTYTWETTVTEMRIRRTELEPEQLGIVGRRQSLEEFGVLPDETISSGLAAEGYSERLVARFDTRHEIAMPLVVGGDHASLTVRPFLVGRFTAYDDQFDEFREANASDEQAAHRLWGAAGVTVATSLQRVYNGIDSLVLDLHRVRHVVEPSITVWQAESSLGAAELPIYDDDVEGLAEDQAVRAAVDQTFQTKRGGAGRWRSVDVLRLNAEYVWFRDRSQARSAIGRYDQTRPELSVPGEFGRLDAAWQVSDAFGLSGETIYDFITNQQDTSAAGVTIQHSPYFFTRAELRYINPQDASFASASATYMLGQKYNVTGAATYDLDLQDFQSYTITLSRSFPDLIVAAGLRYNNIRGETAFTFSLRPRGIGTLFTASQDPGTN